MLLTQRPVVAKLEFLFPMIMLLTMVVNVNARADHVTATSTGDTIEISTEDITATPTDDTTTTMEQIKCSLMEKLQQSKHVMKNHTKHISEKPHYVGMGPRVEELADWVVEKWQNSVDIVERQDYEFYISLPDNSRPNKVTLINGNGEVEYTSTPVEDGMELLDDGENGVLSFYHIYGKPGVVESSEPVYVNFGRKEDLDALERNGIDLKDKLAIARIKTGTFVTYDNIVKKGMKALILYNDPSEVAADCDHNTMEELASCTAQLSYDKVKGDTTLRGYLRQLQYLSEPLTPTWPSVPNSYRIPADKYDLHKTENLPMISQPIGYNDAKVFMEKLAGATPPSDDWIGHLPGVEYNVGGGFKDEFENWKIRLEVNNILKTVTSSNVYGMIEGEVEKDRYVIIGNHRDAVSYGSHDASAGLAELTEVAKAFSEVMQETGWRPRRSIVFASWTAEEHGIYGSSEFVQHKLKNIRQNAVTYFNLDCCGGGSYAITWVQPEVEMFFKSILNSTPHPRDVPGKTFVDYMAELQKDEEFEPIVRKPMRIISDHLPFFIRAGIPSIDMIFFELLKKDYPALGFYGGIPHYHTAYDNFELMDTIIDPDNFMHLNCARLVTLFLLGMAEAKILPYNMVNVSTALEAGLENAQIVALKEQYDIELTHLEEAVNNFKIKASKFHEWKDELNADEMSDLELRQLNDQQMLTLQMFTSDDGLPFHPEVKNIIFAPRTFQGLLDISGEIQKVNSDEPRYGELIEMGKKHVSDIMIAIQNAAGVLDRDTIF